jgi:AcrR family transcriptional regulator
MAKTPAANKSDTKLQIIESAIKLFHENGAQWVSFKMIADKVGISQPAIYKHYQDKDDLLKSCILYSAQSGREIIDTNVNLRTSAEDKLKAYLEGNLMWACFKPQEGAIVLSMYYYALNHKPIFELMNMIHAQSIQRLSLHLESGQKEKSWKLKNTPALARAIHDLLLGEMIKTVHDPKDMPLEERVNFLWGNVGRLLET